MIKNNVFWKNQLSVCKNNLNVELKNTLNFGDIRKSLLGWFALTKVMNIPHSTFLLFLYPTMMMM